MPWPTEDAALYIAERLTELAPLLPAAASIGSGWRTRWRQAGLPQLPALTIGKNSVSQGCFDQRKIDSAASVSISLIALSSHAKAKWRTVLHVWYFRTTNPTCSILYCPNKYTVYLGSRIYQNIRVDCSSVVPLCKRFLSFWLGISYLFRHWYLNTCSVPCANLNSRVSEFQQYSYQNLLVYSNS